MKRDKIHIPLSERRDGKDVLLRFVEQFVIYQDPVDRSKISEWHLGVFNSHFADPKCRYCRDTGHHGAGPLAPLTTMDCMHCGKAKEIEAESRRVFGLEDRVRELEKIVADATLAAGKLP